MNCLGEDCRHGGIYSPNSHCQRYCSACLRWFHLGCLSCVEEELTLDMILGHGHECQQTLGTRFLRFISAPIERGGLFGVVGNGRHQLWAREIGCNGIVTASWFKDVDAVYLEKCESMDMVYFRCPTCHRVI
jgi:hypothetical protein